MYLLSGGSRCKVNLFMDSDSIFKQVKNLLENQYTIEQRIDKFKR